MAAPPLQQPQPLSDAEVRKVAHLARLAIAEDRIHPLRDQLAAVLTYIDRLRRLDLKGVEPLAHVGEGTNRLHDDTPGPTLTNETVMKLAPDALPPFVKVPKVLDEGNA
jgi:aspartyl-tRNA(Asn)/glutamyl-tRNA(Gln) amidotransferase subunit C